MTEFIITFSFFFFLIVLLFFVSQSKIESYYTHQNRMDNVLKCKRIGDFIASNLSFKQNELDIQSISDYLNKTNEFSIVWNDEKGFHKIGNITADLRASRIYVINGELQQVEVMCK